MPKLPDPLQPVPPIPRSPLLSLCSLCSGRRPAAGGWLFPSCLCVFAAKSRTLHLSNSLYTCRESSTNQTFYAKQTQSPKPQNHRNILYHKELQKYCVPPDLQKQTQSNPICRGPAHAASPSRRGEAGFPRRNTTPVPMPFIGIRTKSPLGLWKFVVGVILSGCNVKLWEFKND